MSELTKEYIGKEYGIGDPTKADPGWPRDPEAVCVIETGEYLLPDECAVIMNAMARELLAYRESYRPTIYDQGNTGASVGYAAAAAMDFLNHTASLRSLRDAGDEEVELLHEEIGFSFGNPYVDQQKKSREALENLRLVAITRGQTRTDAVNKAAEWAKECEGLQEQLRKYRQIDERVKEIAVKYAKDCPDVETIDTYARIWAIEQSLLGLNLACDDLHGIIATLTAERDQWKKQCESECQYGYLRQDELDAVKAELAALKSCPAMEEVDNLRFNINDVQLPPEERIKAALEACDIARRLIAAREEVVGLLKWLDEFWDFKEVKKCLCEYASDKVYGDDQQKARRIIEIVEGK